MRRWAVVVVLVLAAAGAGACSDDPTDDAAAVQAMVLETCAPPVDGVPDESDPICRCAYEALLDELGSEELARLDEQLRHDPDALPEEAQRIVLECAFDAVAPDVPPVPTTNAPTTTTEPDAADDNDETTTTSTWLFFVGSTASMTPGMTRNGLGGGSRRRRWASGRGSSRPACA